MRTGSHETKSSQCIHPADSPCFAGFAAEDVTVCGSITREDVADLVLKALRRCALLTNAASSTSQTRSRVCEVDNLNKQVPCPPIHFWRSDLANNKVLSAVDRATMDDQFEVFSL